jgi:rod shape-determining protein MreD
MTVLLGALLLGLLLGPWALGRLGPDWPVLAVVVVAASRPREEATLLAALTGLLAGAFSGAPFATQAMVLAILAWLAGAATQRVFAGALPVRVAVLGGAVLAAELLGVLVGRLVAPAAAAGVELVPGRVLATALVGVVLWPSPRPGREVEAA